MRALILAVLVLILLQGCTAVNWAADRVAYGVNAYCDRFTPMERQLMRAKVNLQTRPDTIRIECYEDKRHAY